MKSFFIFSFSLLFLTVSKPLLSNDQIDAHSIGHVIGGLGSYFLGPLPGLGLAILPEALTMIGNDKLFQSSPESFLVNEYSKEYTIKPVFADKFDQITQYENTVTLINSIQYK